MRDERGFTMIELMIAMLVSMLVLGSAASVISAVQNTYAHQMDDATVEQEARFAMDWIRRTIEQAGSNPIQRLGHRLSVGRHGRPGDPDGPGRRRPTRRHPRPGRRRDSGRADRRFRRQL